MNKLFEQGAFRDYSETSLFEARSIIDEYKQNYYTTVFISHKHDDLEDLRGFLGFLEKRYKVKVYIDSQDPLMPKKTSAETARNLKDRIKRCDKFILLATNGAIESKWCNWELGYGDAHKYINNIALLPMKPKGSLDSQYKGAEYLSIYPYISASIKTNNYYYSNELYDLYVNYPDNKIINLGDWLKR